MDKDLRREIILDNYQNPFHMKKIDDDNYIKINKRKRVKIMRIKYEIIKRIHNNKSINYSYVCSFKNLKNAVNFMTKARNYNNNFYILRGRMVNV